jgi:hypothetical protein
MAQKPGFLKKPGFWQQARMRKSFRPAIGKGDKKVACLCKLQGATVTFGKFSYYLASN